MASRQMTVFDGAICRPDRFQRSKIKAPETNRQTLVKVKDCLALLRSEDTDAKERLRAMQALVNADKLHHLTARERRDIDRYIRWGMITMPWVERLPIDD